MPAYDYLPHLFNGNALTGGNLRVIFKDGGNNPALTRVFSSVEAAVVGLGDRHVRAQPKGMTWELHVYLTNTDETDLQSMMQIFDEEAGLVFFQAKDGAASPVTWRVQCQVQQIRRINRSHFLIFLRVANPLWEAVTEVTTTRLAMSGDSDAFTIANNGNRKTRPTSIAITPQKGKGDVGIVEDYKLSILGAIANRAPGMWNDDPILLVDGLNHSTLVTGNVRALINEAGGIDDSQDTIVYDTGQNDNPPVKGMLMLGTEQIYYTGGGGGTTGTLTGCKRGIGGTTAVTHADSSEMKFSEGLANGDDIRVWLNQVEVDRWLDGANTSSLKVWVNVTMAARSLLTPVVAPTATVPADGGTLEFQEGVAGLPDSGFLLEAGEIITYKGRSADLKSITGIERGAWGTAAVSHGGIEKPWSRGDYLVVVSCGFAKAGVPPSPDSRRPCIQLKASTNLRWYFGDEIDDPKTSFWDQAEPNRSAQWRPSTQQDLLDRAVPLRLVESDDFVGWDTNDPIVGKPLVTRLTLDLPQGIKKAADAINYDVLEAPDMRLRIIGVDKAGLEVELADRQHITDTLGFDGKITPDAVLHKLIYNGIRAYTTIQATDETGQDLELASAISVYYRMILDQDTIITALQTKLKKDAGGDNFMFALSIHDNSGDDPSLGIPVMNFALTSGSGFNASDLTTAFVLYEFSNTDPTKLIAGTYWLRIQISSYTSGKLLMPGGHPRTKNVNRFDGTNFNVSVTSWFLLHEHGEPIQPESVDQDDSGNSAALGDVDFLLNDTAGDVMVPLVIIDTAFTADFYHCVGQLAGTESGDSFDLDVWLQVTGGAATLTINAEARSVIYTRGQEQYSLPAVLIPSNLDDWQPLLPGTNNETYTEKDMVEVDLVIKHRDAKV